MYMNRTTTLGAAKWADMEDIAHRYAYNPETDIFLGRNPYDFSQPLGVSDDRHIFVCAGTRGGKGRSLVIPNLLNWRGSIVAPDPKGENASVCAVRRAQLGQKTYVLDPYRASKVPEELRGSCNILDVLDPESGSLLNDCASLAEAMRISKGEGESEQWSRDAAEITNLIIAHVVTSDQLENINPAEPVSRDLVLVRHLILSGLTAVNEAIEAHNAKEISAARHENRKAQILERVDPFEELLVSMTKSHAIRGKLAARAQSLLDIMRQNVRQYGSLLKNARDELAFMDDFAMEEQLSARPESGRSFKLSDLPNDPDGVSVFLCLPDNPTHPAIRWQNVFITLLLQEMRKEQGLPANGKPVLVMLDEFASMGKLDVIEHGINTVAGAGVKLFIVVTNLATLKKIYKEEGMEAIISGCGVQMWFETAYSNTTGKYIETSFGETEVVIVQKGRNESVAEGETEGVSTSESEGYSDTFTESEAEAIGVTESSTSSTSHNQSLSVTDTSSWNEGESVSKSNSRGSQSGWSFNKSLTRGGSSNYSENHEPGSLFGSALKSTNSGRGLNRSRTDGTSQSGGVNHNVTFGQTTSTGKGGSQATGSTSGTTTGTSDSSGKSKTKTLSEAYARGMTYTSSQTRSSSKTTTRSKGFSETETFHKRPLITIPEQNIWLASVGVQDDPAYPGFALVRISGEDPFLSRKCYYDQDWLFDGIFTPHYAYKYIPKAHQRLVGGEYTPEHFVPVRVPTALIGYEAPIEFILERSTDEWFEADETIFSWIAPAYSHNRHILDNLHSSFPPYIPGRVHEEPKPDIELFVGRPLLGKMEIKSPLSGKVVDYALIDALQEDGDIVLLRFERPFNAEYRARFETVIFEEILNYYRARDVLENSLNSHIIDLNSMYFRDSIKQQSERDRLQQRQIAFDRAETERRERERQESLERTRRENQRTREIRRLELLIDSTSNKIIDKGVFIFLAIPIFYWPVFFLLFLNPLLAVVYAAVIIFVLNSIYRYYYEIELRDNLKKQLEQHKPPEKSPKQSQISQNEIRSDRRTFEDWLEDLPLLPRKLGKIALEIVYIVIGLGFIISILAAIFLISKYFRS